MASFIPQITPPSHQSVVVRSLPTLSAKERKDILKDVEYNIFNFPAALLTCDFLTDSGTSAMTDVQWAALLRGDESYGRNWGYFCLLDAFRDIFERGNDRKHIFQTVAMGMADVEFYRNEILISYEKGFVNGGTHQLQRPNFFIFPSELVGKENPFKGNMDLAALESFLNKTSEVALILVTITNNWAAGQPVSMANIRGTASLARRHRIPLFFDACRFAENAFFIHQYEKGYSDVPIAEIIREMFSYADGFTISLKKDGLANMGGVLCFHDDRLFSKQFEGIGQIIKERQLLWYGNDAYGGMSGRDLMAAAAGLYETTKLSFLRKRVSQVQSFAQKLHANGVATLSPPGGHAIYLDMEEFFYGCDRKLEDFASVGFTLKLIEEYGIRAIESGPFAWEFDKKSPEERAKIPNLVRFALPRHVLSDEHIDYAVAAIKELYKRRDTIPNVVITRGKEMRVRHFQAAMQPVLAARTDRSYVAEAARQLSDISQAVGQDDETRKRLLSALNLAGGNWGQTTIPPKLDNSAWKSNVSNDHSPVEYSIALSQKTGDVELRFLIEAQPEGNNLAQLQESSLQLNEAILAEYGSKSVSFDRFNLLRDIFMPPQAEGLLAAWHSFAATNTKWKWKMYLNPLASGQDRAKSLDTTREAFERLGLASSWTILESILSANDYIIYFALGLAPDLDDAEVKAYVAHPGASAEQIAHKHIAICPEASAYEIQHFCASLSGGSLGPYTSKPLISCFAFKRKDPRVTRTVLFPMDSYAASDEEAQERVEKYMHDIHAPLLYRERYRKAITAIRRRPLAAGRGIHSWISLKQNPDGARSNTYYLSPEFFGPLQDGLTNGSL
ncbi:pyridoxal phosphate-dependent transferase [Hypomontagnella monticulosa]|nr:pyridoxal phosphate-dependent transferase [Hypomontagnella monticulosa]